MELRTLEKEQKMAQMIELKPIAHTQKCTKCGKLIPSMESFWTKDYSMKGEILCHGCYTSKLSFFP